MLLYFGSGFTSLLLQGIFVKKLSLVFGVTSQAMAAVLVAFMFGLAVGARACAEIGERIKYPIILYGLLEFSIGLYGLYFIDLLDLFKPGYFYLYNQSDNIFTLVLILRLLFAILLIFLPTFLMGASLPLLAVALRQFQQIGKLNRYYGINIIGAACGTIIVAYYLMPSLGILSSLHFVFTINSLILLLAFAVTALNSPRQEEHSTKKKSGTATKKKIKFKNPLKDREIYLTAFLSGFLIFSFEIIWNHLLSVVVGTSIYAYAIMTSSTLIAMGLASFYVQQRTDKFQNTGKAIAISMYLFTLTALVSLLFWDRIPNIFLAFNFVNNSFLLMETIRFVVCFIIVIVPAFFAGLIFPTLLFLIEHDKKAAVKKIGVMYWINTAGTIVGSICGGFILINYLGSRGSFILLASCSSIWAIYLATKQNIPKWISGAATAFIVIFILALPSWNLKSFLSGAHIYFSKYNDKIDQVLFHEEDNAGGVTSVVKHKGVQTLLTNAKFEGNDGNEIKDQQHFALIPNLFVKNYQRAMNIGLGTGSTLHMIASFPYKTIDCVELSPNIVKAARKFFHHINGNVLDDPRVNIHINDGRNYLLNRIYERKEGKTLENYDLISIELTSIWFAGAANLYSQEFYQLVKKNLNKAGILQQWLQLHHISLQDIGVILKTLKENFKYVQLWLPSHQGIVIASDSPITYHSDQLKLNQNISKNVFFVEKPYTILGDILLDTAGIASYIESLEQKKGLLPQSTDNNLYLEYSTPKGNALGYNFSDNFSSLYQFSNDNWINKAVKSSSLAQALPYIQLGRAHFFPTGSLQWHQSVAAGLRQLPEAEVIDIRTKLVKLLFER